MGFQVSSQSCVLVTPMEKLRGLALLPLSGDVWATICPSAQTGNLKLRVEKRDGNEVEGMTCSRYEGGSYIDKFR